MFHGYLLHMLPIPILPHPLTGAATMKRYALFILPGAAIMKKYVQRGWQEWDVLERKGNLPVFTLMLHQI